MELDMITLGQWEIILEDEVIGWGLEMEYSDFVVDDDDDGDVEEEVGGEERECRIDSAGHLCISCRQCDHQHQHGMSKEG